MYIVDNQEDFLRYFTGTYIAKREKEHMVPYYVVDAASAISVRLLKCEKALRTDVNVRFTELVDAFKLTVPKLGAISTEFGLCHASVSPVRQYLKGVTDRRIKFVSLTGLKDESLLGDTNVFHVFNNKFFTGEELLALIKEGQRLGGAVSHKLGIYIKPKIKFPMLSYRSMVMGVIENDTDIKVLKRFEEYKDYVQKHFPSRNIKIWTP